MKKPRKLKLGKKAARKAKKDEAEIGRKSTTATLPNGRAPPQPSLSRATLLEDLHISQDYASPANPSPWLFSAEVKQQCWDKADKVQGRDPDRWRRDALGNIVFHKFYRCTGSLCHDYDHIVPISEGGKSNLENCQVLQATATRLKWKNKDIPLSDLSSESSYCSVEDSDMDVIERYAYGNVRRAPDSGGCRVQ